MQIILASQKHVWCTYGARYKRTPNCFNPVDQECVSLKKKTLMSISKIQNVLNFQFR